MIIKAAVLECALGLRLCSFGFGVQGLGFAARG